MVEGITALPLQNGLPHTPDLEMQDQLKRKRLDSPTRPEQPYINGITPNVPPENYHHENQNALGISLRKVLETSKTADTSPSLLHHLIPLAPTSDVQDTEQPSLKRLKLSSSIDSESIASKVERDAYGSGHEFVADVEATSADLIRNANQQPTFLNGDGHTHPESMTQQRDKFISDVVALQQRLTSAVYPDVSPSTQHMPNGTGLHAENDAFQVHEQAQEVIEEPIDEVIEAEEGRYVLSLTGSHQGHKQLFSSFQKSVAQRDRSNTESGSIKSSDDLSLHLHHLPNGITATQISMKRKRVEDSLYQKRLPTPTFVDVFAPPSSLLQITPPPRTPMSPSRNSSITWTRSTSGTNSSRQFGYNHQQSRTGEWLGYGGLAPAEIPSSPEAKRKKRDRALSSGESSLVPSDGALAAQLQAKEEALFRSVYSSFAPISDNAAALVPSDTRSEVWWERQGKKAFAEVFAIDPTLEDANHHEQIQNHIENGDVEEAAFHDAVNQFIPSSLTANSSAPKEDKVDKETNEILTEISEMLETLHSYQRIRNSSLNLPSRTPMGSNSSLQDLTGNPSTPSTAELETYKTLKAQLALMVSMLPPYAVSKLNGDQLAELNISTSMFVNQEPTRGVLDEDAGARLAKQAAMSAAVGNAGMQGRQSMNAYQQGGANARTAQMGQQGRTGAQSQYYAGASTVPRNAGGYQRQPLSAWQTPTQSYTSNTHRPGYQNHTQSAPRLAPGRMQPLAQFTQPQQQHQHQQAQQQQRAPNYPNQNSPMAPMQTPTQPAYQQKAQQQAYNYTGNTYGGAGSPPRMGQYGGAAQQNYYPHYGQHQQQAQPQYNQRPGSAGSFGAGSPQPISSWQQRPTFTPQMATPQQQPTPVSAASPPPQPQLQRPLAAVHPPASPQSSQQQQQQAQAPPTPNRPQSIPQSNSPFPRPQSAKMTATADASTPATSASPVPTAGTSQSQNSALAAQQPVPMQGHSRAENTLQPPEPQPQPVQPAPEPQAAPVESEEPPVPPPPPPEQQEAPPPPSAATDAAPTPEPAPATLQPERTSTEAPTAAQDTEMIDVANEESAP